MKFTQRKTFRFEALLRTVAAIILGITLSVAPFDAGLFSTGVSSIDETVGRIVSTQKVEANSTYVALSSGTYSFTVTGNPGQITSNDNWAGVNSAEGYKGDGLTGSTGVDPQTVTTTEFAASSHLLPNTPANVAANKNNPNAYNAGGVAEFDSGTYQAIGLQGSGQANPYLVFYLNTSGRSNVTMNYDVIDIDAGSNNSVSPVALQYRVGTTGAFINIPAGYIADATQGPTIAGLVNSKSVVLPAAAWNQSQVQVRIIVTNAPGSDEWVGVNNVAVTSLAPTAAPADIGGRVMSQDGRSVSGAIMMLVDEFGLQRTAVTNSFGYYRFTGIPVGATYVVSVVSKRYQFEPQVVTLMENLAGLNFYSLPPMGTITAVAETKLGAKSIQSGRIY